MSGRLVRLLVIEDDPEQVELLEEAFQEMDETRFSRPVIPDCDRSYAVSLEEALALLRDNPYEAILMTAALATHPSLAAFLAVRAEAPQTPVVVMAQPEDEALGLSLVRQGAQDYLVRSDLDCLPLARAIRCAIERNRLVAAQQSIALVDDLTGLYNRRGFLEVAGRDLRLAARYGGTRQFLLAESLSRELDSHSRDLFLIQLADLLRDWAGETGILARVDGARFAVLGGPEDLGRLARQLRKQMPEHCQVSLSDPFASADLDLEFLLPAPCDNDGVEGRAGRHV